jgi:hypothetical protein
VISLAVAAFRVVAKALIERKLKRRVFCGLEKNAKNAENYGKEVDEKTFDCCGG